VVYDPGMAEIASAVDALPFFVNSGPAFNA